MTGFRTSAILMRRVDYGDHDLILTLYTRETGQQSVIAKNAKKSARRFAGRLELFSGITAIYSRGRKGSLPVLQEADLTHPHAGIRTSILKTTVASYWVELVWMWTEEGTPVDGLFDLLLFVLDGLAENRLSESHLSILFQMRFLVLSGLCPNLSACCACKTDLEQMRQRSAVFDLDRGSLACDRFECGTAGEFMLSKGTIKQLQWIQSGDLERAARSRFSAESVYEAQTFLEGFVLHHLGRRPKSLSVLHQIRDRGACAAPPSIVRPEGQN
ncbi:MAG: DNA repair protein RecO [Desulfobacterales bacterium]|jgi:DNA repair protein RecO (recombination protein O)